MASSMGDIVSSMKCCFACHNPDRSSSGPLLLLPHADCVW
jgi:cytochrome c551/c552